MLVLETSHRSISRLGGEIELAGGRPLLEIAEYSDGLVFGSCNEKRRCVTKADVEVMPERRGGAEQANR